MRTKAKVCDCERRFVENIFFNSSIGDSTWRMVTSRSCIAWEFVSKEHDVGSGMAELAKEVVMEGEGG